MGEVLIVSFRRFVPVVAAFAAAQAVVVVACSNSGSSEGAPPSCLGDPTACSAGETCWPLDPSHFSCIAASSSGTFGQSCQNSFGAATCADGFACDQSTPTNGVCTPYCSASKTCPDGYTCTSVAAGDAGATVSLCRTDQSTPVGTQTGGGGGDAGGVVLTPDGSLPVGTDDDGGSPVVQQ